VVLLAMLGYDGAAGGRPSIGHLERGLKKNRSLPTLKKLARALGVPVTELLK
jgi:hypothetical protein